MRSLPAEFTVLRQRQNGLRIAAAALLLAGCGNYGNVYMPQGERKPFLGPDPKEFQAALERPQPVAGHTLIRLNIASASGLSLKASWTAREAGSIVWRVNARKIATISCGPGDCRADERIPDGTILPGVATLVEIETSSSIVLERLTIDR